MTQFTTSKGRFAAVYVRSGEYSEYRFWYNILQGFSIPFEYWQTIAFFPVLPEHTYTIIGIASELSEEMCRGVVDAVRSSMASIKAGYYDYENTDTVNNATASFLSLLRSHNIPNNSLILKIEE